MRRSTPRGRPPASASATMAAYLSPIHAEAPVIATSSVLVLALAQTGVPTYPNAWSATRASVSSNGAQGNAGSGDPALSSDGRFVAFVSDATNLVPGDTNAWPDVFVRDLASGVTGRVTVDSAGNQANANSYEPALSADGRFVAFQSYASNLVPGDTNATSDIFVHDRLSGTTERVSVDSAGNQGNLASYHPAISADGRFVSFQSDANNLVPGDANLRHDVFVHDRVSGATELVSVDSAENQANGSSTFSSLSADGRYVAFESDATNLAPQETFSMPDVFVRDRVSGTTELVSISSFDYPIGGEKPALSPDGRYV